MVEDNHNHFCIYCGAKLVPNQHFCSQCGKEVYHDPVQGFKIHSNYESKVKQLEEEYNSKQAKARELVDKLFDPSHISYSNFTAAIDRSNQLFANQLKITQKMMELESSEVVNRQIEDKIRVLNTFIDKMEELINELVIQLSSNKDDNDDINALFKDMDDLIGSVKDY
ncbi:MAG: zinc ribbon domain-containing protein [Methanobrevibacter thaueri]|uniref:Zinc ribbon domain-containing protein n=1 Tax=Methanobrevibacter thaueri TaxID=190975 RepID=A0A8T3V4B1_9EURY|nr:zinc ribbon domain-containing protein [Methanobrevibacter thaueri]MBE6501372.1 zinc ribbon domain-containing protein [Methanobrevibacter thaueri]